jgi:integrase
MEKSLELAGAWEMYRTAVLSSSKMRSQITESGRWKNYINPELGRRSIENLTNLDLLVLRRGLENRGLSPQTVCHCLSLLRRVLIKAYEWNQYDKRLPSFKGVMPKFDNKRIRFLNREELRTILDILTREKTKNWHDIALFAVNTGLRRGEIFNLRLNDVNFSNGIVMVLDTKSNKNRSVQLNDIAFDIVLKKSNLHTETTTCFKIDRREFSETRCKNPD